MFTSERIDATHRLTEVRQLLETIKTLESPTPNLPDGTEVLILRGLFYVQLYAVLEFSVNRSVERLFQAIADLKVKAAHFEPIFLSVALDSEFSSLAGTVEKNSARWSRRVAILAKQSSLAEVALNEGVFSTYLQNIWKENLQQVFDCLFIKDPIVPEPAFSLYIDEIVNKRNQVAHGRQSPVRVGAGTRSPDLHIRLDAVSGVITHLIQCFEKHLTDRNFIRAEMRAQYAAT